MSRFEERLADAVDPRLRDELLIQLAASGGSPIRVGREQQIVLVGQRAAGKTRVLPLICELTGRAGFDLDAEIARRSGRLLREWIAVDPAGFRQAERETFAQLPRASVIAAGGGFLSLHSDLLRTELAVQVPVTFETYRERLLADTTRPRLHPEVSLEQEITSVFTTREALHVQVPTISLADFVRRYQRGERK